MRIKIVADEGKESQLNGWLVSDGISPGGWEYESLWPKSGDPQSDPRTHIWCSANVTSTGHSSLTARMDAVNSPPNGDPYHYYDATTDNQAILDELVLKVGDTGE